MLGKLRGDQRQGEWTLGGEHTVQCKDDVLQNCTPEIYIILPTNATPAGNGKKHRQTETGV